MISPTIKIRLICNSRTALASQIRCFSDERSSSGSSIDSKLDFVPQISKATFPDPETQRLKRGTGGRSSWNGQVVTVFGATGLTGRAVVTLLGRQGSQVIVPYRGHPHFARYLKLCGDLGAIQFSPFHLKDVDSLYRAMKYSNVVINLIGKGIETTNFDFDAVHVEGARTIARIAKESGVRRLIHVSALNVQPELTRHVLKKKGSNFYRSKYYGELAVREEFPEATIFRPASIWGQEDKFLFPLAKWQRRQIWRLPLWEGGRGVFKQPVWMYDLAKGIVYSITDNEAIGNTYEAYGPRRYEFRDLAEYVGSCIQKGPEDGWIITNMKYQPLYWLRIAWQSYKWQKYPAVDWEQIEREMVTDTPTGYPTLEDLGVHQTPLEDRLFYELKTYRRNGKYPDEVGEFPEKPLPPAERRREDYNPNKDWENLVHDMPPHMVPYTMRDVAVEKYNRIIAERRLYDKNRRMRELNEKIGGGKFHQDKHDFVNKI